MSTKRLIFTASFKAEVVLQLLSGAKTQAELCREHELAPQLLLQWKQTFNWYLYLKPLPLREDLWLRRIQWL